LTTYTHHSESQVITAPSLFSTLYKSTQHPPRLSQPAVFTSRCLAMASNFPRSGPIFTASLAELKYNANLKLTVLPQFFFYNSSGRTTSKTPFVYCYVRVRFREKMFTEPLIRKGSLFIRLLHNNFCVSSRLCPATGIYLKIYSIQLVAQTVRLH
jgi:hypothetical protein